MSSLLVGCVIAGLLAGCGPDPLSCERVGRHVAVLRARVEFGSEDAFRDNRSWRGYAAPSIAACSGYASATRRCVLAAENLDALAGCGVEIDARSAAFSGDGGVAPAAVPALRPRWVALVSDPAYDSSVRAVRVDGDQVVAAGEVGHGGIIGEVDAQVSGATDVFVAAWSQAGGQRWAVTLGGPGGDLVNALAVARDGTVWLAGQSELPLDGGRRPRPDDEATGFLARVSRDGAVIEQRDLGRVVITGLTTTERGDVVIVGRAAGQVDLGGGALRCGEESLLLARFGVAGAQVWARCLPITDMGPLATALRVDGSAVQLCGTIVAGGTLGERELLTVPASSSGSSTVFRADVDLDSGDLRTGYGLLGWSSAACELGLETRDGDWLLAGQANEAIFSPIGHVPGASPALRRDLDRPRAEALAIRLAPDGRPRWEWRGRRWSEVAGGGELSDGRIVLAIFDGLGSGSLQVLDAHGRDLGAARVELALPSHVDDGESLRSPWPLGLAVGPDDNVYVAGAEVVGHESRGVLAALRVE